MGEAQQDNNCSFPSEEWSIHCRYNEALRPWTCDHYISHKIPYAGREARGILYEFSKIATLVRCRAEISQQRGSGVALSPENIPASIGLRSPLPLSNVVEIHDWLARFG